MSTERGPCDRDRRDLAADDLEAIAVLYGSDEPESPDVGGCAAAGMGRGGDVADSAALLGLMALAIWLTARRRRMPDDGALALALTRRRGR